MAAKTCQTQRRAAAPRPRRSRDAVAGGGLRPAQAGLREPWAGSHRSDERPGLSEPAPTGSAAKTAPRPTETLTEGIEPPEPEALLAGALDRPVARILDEARQRAFDASKGRCAPHQTTIAIECVDLSTGLRLVSSRSEEPMVPASNLKVVTAGATLLGLGADAQFETVFEAIGRRRRSPRRRLWSAPAPTRARGGGSLAPGS